MDTLQSQVDEPLTVDHILTRYEAECLPNLGPRTQRDYRRHLRHLSRTFGPRVACELRPRDFGPFLQVPKGKIQRVRQLAVLSAAFTQAVSFWYVLDRNVLRDVKRPKSRPRDRLISDEEFMSFKSYVPYRVRLAMDLALLTGQRQGDLLALRWADIKETGVDEKTGKPTFEVRIQQAKTGKRLGIEVTPELESVLDKCWQLPMGGCDGGEHVLTKTPKAGGGRYTSEGFRACWQRGMRRWKKVREGFTFHDIRALCASKCATPEIAMRLLGHSNISMTMRVYRRSIERVKPLSVLLAA